MINDHSRSRLLLIEIQVDGKLPIQNKIALWNEGWERDFDEIENMYYIIQPLDLRLLSFLREIVSEVALAFCFSHSMSDLHHNCPT